MTGVGAHFHQPAGLGRRLGSRGDLTGYLMALTREINADSYMLVSILHDQNRSDVRIIASNWVYDAIQLVGHQLIANIAQGPLATTPGVRPKPLATAQAPLVPGIVTGEEAKLLDVLGHEEIYSLRLNIGRQRFFLLMSTGEAGRLQASDLMKAQMQCCYALSQVPDLLAAAAQQDPLSDRERECLFWVSEGKTTDEVGMILGVASTTVTGYITHAMQKFSSSNRSMAVATAIRRGIL